MYTIYTTILELLVALYACPCAQLEHPDYRARVAAVDTLERGGYFALPALLDSNSELAANVASRLVPLDLLRANRVQWLAIAALSAEPNATRSWNTYSDQYRAWELHLRTMHDVALYLQLQKDGDPPAWLCEGAVWNPDYAFGSQMYWWARAMKDRADTYYLIAPMPRAVYNESTNDETP